MSDPEVPESDNEPTGVDDVVGSAQESLAQAEAAASATGAPEATESDAAAAAAGVAPAAAAHADEPLAVDSIDDPVLAAFEAAEREHPGTFSGIAAPADAPEPAPAEASAYAAPVAAEPVAEEPSVASDAPGAADFAAPAEPELSASAAPEPSAPAAEAPPAYTPPVAETAAYATAASTQLLPPEPTYPVAEPAPQPIFVQAPEPPRPIGNRATAGVIGLLATIVFAVLYLGTKLGVELLAGGTALSEIGTSALSHLQSWGLWLPVVAFFIGFWLLGAIINRGRWGAWVIFGVIVGLFAYVGHIAGVLFDAPFWMQTTSQVQELVVGELLALQAIAAFVFGREITIWFGAWIARSGARKNELNAEAQREYERTLEAGPTLSR